MGINSLIEDAIGLVKTNPISTAVGVGTVALGGSVLAGTIIRRKTKKKTRKSTHRKSKNRKSSRRNKKTKRKHTSTKRIHYTKKGQPYVYLANGRARFIKKTSARRSKKLKGGRY